jgi:hypothetical protein
MLRVGFGLLLDYLVLPALEDIFIQGTSFLSLISLVHRSSCTLRKLVTADNEDICTLLEHIPTLSELHCWDNTRDFIPCLTVPSNCDPDFRPLCPELRALHIITDIGRDVDYSNRITQLMESRHKTALCPPLSLSVYDIEAPPHVLEMQSTLRQRGMDIQWLTEESRKLYSTSLYNSYP